MKYGETYSREDLKRKVLQGGYSEKEFEEAANFLGIPEKPFKISREVDENENEVIESESMKHEIKEVEIPETNRKNRRMKIAGIFGVIIFVFILLGFISLFFSVPIINYIKGNIGILDLNNSSNKMIYSLVIGGIIIVFLLFMQGFAKLGKSAELGLLRISSFLVMIASFILGIFLILLIAGFFVRKTDSFDVFNGNYLEFLSNSIPILFGVLLVLLVLEVLFFMGLMLLRRKVRFAFSAGLFGILFIFSLIVLLCAFVFVPGILDIIAGNKAVIISVSVVLGVLILLTMILEILTLFNGARKFE